MIDLLAAIYYNPYALTIAIGLLIMIVLAPTEVAYTRRHNNRLAILVLNVLLGMTGIGWALALVWSCTSNVEAEA